MAKKKETKKAEEAVTGEVQQPKEEKKPNRLGDLISRIESRFGKEHGGMGAGDRGFRRDKTEEMI